MAEADERSTVLQFKYDPSPAPAVSFVLRVTAGPDQGASYTLDGSKPSRVLVGTSESCDLRLTDPQVSRRHVALEIEGRTLRVVDLGSKNGTLLDRIRVRDASVRGGEELHMGSTTLQIDATPLAVKPAPLTVATSFGRLRGASREMRRLYPLCERLAAVMIPLIIEGETGTGKEVLAESLHEQSPRAAGPFIVFDCTAVPPSLAESELFGHERGAFTGAVSTRKGVFEQADGGTLLIDEIGDLPLDLQPKLLRALERSEIRRVGGDRWIKVDVRVLAATRRDMDREVQSGRFRDDLFHRLAVGRIELPPLRERNGDLPFLIEGFCRELGADVRTLSPEVVARWHEHSWPGNARELKHAVARTIALGDLSDADWLGAEETTGATIPPPGSDFIEEVLGLKLPLISARQRVVDNFEKRYVLRLLSEHGGNVLRAAAASGIARRHFHRLKARSRV